MAPVMWPIVILRFKASSAAPWSGSSMSPVRGLQISHTHTHRGWSVRREAQNAFYSAARSLRSGQTLPRLCARISGPERLPASLWNRYQPAFIPSTTDCTDSALLIYFSLPLSFKSAFCSSACTGRRLFLTGGSIIYSGALFCAVTAAVSVR